MSAKAVITIDSDEEGQAKAIIHFDPPLPLKEGLTEDQWLELIPATQLAGIVMMDQIVNMFDGDVEIVSFDEVTSGTKH